MNPGEEERRGGGQERRGDQGTEDEVFVLGDRLLAEADAMSVPEIAYLVPRDIGPRCLALCVMPVRHA
eukprot:2779943-Rhodomonas_salina.2